MATVLNALSRWSDGILILRALHAWVETPGRLQPLLYRAGEHSGEQVSPRRYHYGQVCCKTGVVWCALIRIHPSVDCLAAKIYPRFQTFSLSSFWLHTVATSMLHRLSSCRHRVYYLWHKVICDCYLLDNWMVRGQGPRLRNSTKNLLATWIYLIAYHFPSVRWPVLASQKDIGHFHTPP